LALRVVLLERSKLAAIRGKADTLSASIDPPAAAETRALGAPDDFPIQKEYRWKQNKLYYRGKPCAKRKPPEEQK
jgi:hypothetical protein